jgi:hypothetical protein
LIEDPMFLATTIAVVEADAPVAAVVFAVAALSTSRLNAWTDGQPRNR